MGWRRAARDRIPAPSASRGTGRSESTGQWRSIEAAPRVHRRRDVEADVLIKPPIALAAHADLLPALTRKPEPGFVHEIREQRLVLPVIPARRACRRDAVLVQGAGPPRHDDVVVDAIPDGRRRVTGRQTNERR